MKLWLVDLRVVEQVLIDGVPFLPQAQRLKALSIIHYGAVCIKACETFWASIVAVVIACRGFFDVEVSRVPVGTRPLVL